MSKRAQISMNTIVYVSIALLVLILIVAFTTGGLGNLFGQVGETAPGELDSSKARCTSICSTAKINVDSNGHTTWKNSLYCTEKFNIDIDGSGDIDSDEIINCWDTPIAVSCSKSLAVSGGTITLDVPVDGSSSENACDPVGYPVAIVPK
jgi:hypothetical protein